jgi:hypothetical protein
MMAAYPQNSHHVGMRLGARKDLFRYLFCALLSIAYAFFPWESLGITFEDLAVYLERINLLVAGTDGDIPTSGAGFVYFISNEILWRWILSFIGAMFQDPRIGLGIISSFSLFVYSAFLLKRVNPFLAAYFLLNPLFIDLILSQVRISLAFSLLLIAAMANKKMIRVAAAIAAIFIHTASIAFIVFFIILKLMLAKFHRLNFSYLCIFALAGGAVFALYLAFGLNFILSLIGDRRENYVADSSSFLFSSFWFFLALMLCAGQRKISPQDRLVFLYSIAMLSIFFFSSMFGVYGSRFTAVALPLIVFSLSLLPPAYKIPGFYIFGLFQIVQWNYWI